MIKKIVYFIFGVPITLIALLGVTGSVGDKSDTSPLVIFIVLLLLGLLLVFLGIRTKVESPEMKRKRKEYEKTHISSKHQAGLPLAEGATCEIEYGTTGFVFKSSGNTFNMDFSKITDICVKTDAEIQSQYVSSIGGAVGGAVLFGPLGAMIGGRAKKKSTTTLSYYMIITYNKNNAVNYISFEIFEPARAHKIISDFKQNHGVIKNETIEL